VAIEKSVLDAMNVADRRAMRLIRTFMRVRDVSQGQLAQALHMSQTQISRRLNVPGALSYGELAAVAAFFGMPVSVFEKEEREAVNELLGAPDPGQPADGRVQSGCTQARLNLRRSLALSVLQQVPLAVDTAA